ncbi:hypothetical protein AJ80_07790 [Polytolypa hystricis UAMH7299]|uniref:Helix-turn-helix domain-containing protein n=1 Tax=Polytolypa hystricis (strain UAMH7299) TaxID=1447883 RepID=A0A2B7XJ72_POLH7|nr:hypothetical protein AJ80_07790 [Polytolypa hystricis UAMH7299]
MGSAASKPAKAAASAAVRRRQYPKQASPSTTKTATVAGKRSVAPGQPAGSAAVPRQTGPVYHSKEKASATKSEAIDLDARDPHFAASLRALGPVTPFPTLSHSSTFHNPHNNNVNVNNPHSRPPQANPSFLILSSRAQLAREADAELESLGRASQQDRRFLDVVSLRQVVGMRERGVSDRVIERQFRLGEGVLEELGPRGVVGEAR